MEKKKFQSEDTAPGIRNTRSQSAVSNQDAADNVLEDEQSDQTLGEEDVDEESELLGDDEELENDDSIDHINDAGEEEVDGDEISEEDEDMQDEDDEEGNIDKD